VKRAVWALAALVSVAVVGCGGGTKTVTVTTAASTPTTISGPGVTTLAGTGTATVPLPTTATAPTLIHIVHLSSFRSPSGNIGCIVVDGTARCDIRHRTWAPGPRPATCPKEVDYGQGLQVFGSGAGQLVCAGDTALNPTAPKLAYGSQSDEGQFRCASATTGVTCTKPATGHGFFISAQSYRVF
jgi:hypothetical protein